MKTIVLVSVLAATLISTSVAQAKEKTTVYVSKDRVEIQVGLVGYVFDPKAPETLVEVRVWLQVDRLNYNLSATGVSHGDFSKESLTPAQAAAKWAAYVKKFEDIRKEIDVIITD